MEKTINQKAWFLVLPMLVVVAFSAVAGLRGNLGQSDYAYANRVLDALVQWRADHSDHPGASLSIAWPLWADGGMRLPALHFIKGA